MVAINKRLNTAITAPINDLQNNIIHHCLQSEVDGLYIIQFQIELNEEINHLFMAKAWHRALDQHELIRSSINFDSNSDHYYFHMHNKVNYHLKKTDLTHLEIIKKNKAFLELKKQLLTTKFNFRHPPLFTLNLIKLNFNKYFLFWCVHHVLFDGDSTLKIITDAFNIYDAMKNGRMYNLPNLQSKKIYYQYLNDIHEKAAKNFWHGLLANYKPQNFEKKLVRPLQAQQKYLTLTLSKTTTSKIKQAAKSLGVTPTIYFMAAWGLIIALYKNSDDVVFGSVRSFPANITKNQAGDVYLNTLPVRIKLHSSMSVQDLLLQIKEQQKQQKDFLNSPYNLIIENLTLKSGQNLFDSLFDLKLLHLNTALRNNCANWCGRKLSYVTKTDYPLSIEIYTLKNCFGIRISYLSDYFSDQEVHHLAQYYQNYLLNLINDNSKAIASIDCFVAEERQEIISQSSGIKNARAINKKLLFPEIENNKHLAAVDGKQKINYATFFWYAKNLATVLLKYNIESRPIISLFMETSIWQAVAMYTVVRMRAVYLALDIEMPEERLIFQLIDSNCQIVLCTSKTEALIREYCNKANFAGQIINIENININSEQNIAWPEASPSDPVYIIYTSGTTGNPKAVVIEQRNLVNLIQWHRHYYQVTRAARISQIANISFDAATWSIWVALMTGATLYICPDNIKKDPKALIQWHCDNKITHSFIATPIAENMLQQSWPADCGLKFLLVGGDVLHAIPKIKQPFTLVNNYGPTENTVVATATIVKPGTRKPTIGKPIANVQAFVLSKFLQLVPNHVAGELYLAGESLGRGYLNRDELTQQKFTISELNSKLRWYKTGDIVKRHEDGALEFIGRSDQQIKISGYRIELTEIELAIRSFTNISNAIVLFKQEPHPLLIAFYSVRSQVDWQEDQLKDYLAKKLPYYMLPNKYVLLNAMPLTKNGKIDQNHLLQNEKINIVEKNLTERQQIALVKMKIIWATILNLPAETITEASNYFELGGDSISCYRIISEAKHQGFNFGIKELFQNPILADLIKTIISEDSEAKQYQKRSYIGKIKLSPIQHWFLTRYRNEPNHFSHIIKIDLVQNIKISDLKLAIQMSLSAYDNYLIAFNFVDKKSVWEQYYQYNDNQKNNIKIQEYDLSKKKLAIDKAEALIIHHLFHTIDIRKAPLVKIALLNRGKEHYRLVFVIHHLIIDAVSWGLLLDAIENTYKQLINNTNPFVARTNVSYQDWTDLMAKSFAKKKFSVNWLHYQYANQSYIIPEMIKQALLKPLTTFKQDNLYKNSHTIEFVLTALQTIEIKQIAHEWHCSIESILLTALLSAIFNIKKNYSAKLWLMLEHNGRDVLQDKIVLDNTLGWFTNRYPILLGFKTQAAFLENCQSIFNKIKVYGIKGVKYNYWREKYANKRIDSYVIDQPIISFNYLGENDYPNSKIYQNFSMDLRVNPKLFFSNLLDFNSHIENKKLLLKLQYGTHFLTESFAQSLIAQIHASLIAVVTKSEQVSVIDQIGFNQEKIKYALKNNYYAADAIQGIYPLTPLQEGLFFQWRLKPYSKDYHIQTCLDFHGLLNINKFFNSLEKLLNATQVLKTIFNILPKIGLAQIVQKNALIQFKMHHWERNTQRSIRGQYNRFLVEEKNNVFDLGKLPLIRFNLFKIPSNQYRLVVSYHHIIMDGWSLQNLLHKLFSIYNAENSYLQKEDFNLYLAYLKESSDKAQAHYWQRRLLGFDKLTQLYFEQDNTIKNDIEIEVKHLKYHYSATNKFKLNQIAAANNVTLNSVLMTAFSLLLQMYSSNDDILFGITASHRPANINNVASIIGPMIQTLPFRLQLDMQLECFDLIQQVQNLILSDLQQQQPQLNVLQKMTDLDAKTPLFEILYLFENYPKLVVQADKLKIAKISVAEQNQYKLTLMVIDDENLNFDFTFDPRYFTTQKIKTLAKHYFLIIQQFIANQHVLLKDITLLTKKEHFKLLNQWNKTQHNIPARAHVLKYFKKQLAKNPNRKALITNASSLSYAELAARSSQIAHQILKFNEINSTIAIFLERNSDYIACMVAIMALGLRYLPLDIKLPKERLEYILQDANIKLVLTNEQQQAALASINSDINIINLNAKENAYADIITQQSFENFINDDAYLMYTSGSTGMPKGVVITQRNLINFLLGMNRFLHFKAQDKFFALTAFNFDISGLEVWLPLMMGGTIVLADDATQFDAKNIIRTIEKNKINFMQATPITWNLLLAEYWEPAKNMTLLSGGEALTRAIASRLLKPNVKLWNVYGPTETTIWSTSHLVTKADLAHLQIPIGQPIQNTQVYVLNKQLHLVPITMPGELYVAGLGLAREYLNKPELTKQKFISNCNAPNKLMYHTGDIAKWDEQGSLHYLGRIDTQVKIHGFRIELAEIETILNQHYAIENSVVLIKTDAKANKLLLAFLVPKQNDTKQIPTTIELRHHLSQSLPYYMIPQHFIFLDKLPLTHSGKVNRNQLLTTPIQEQSQDFVVAQNETEEKIIVLFAKTLRIPKEQISINDDFFELGGDSIAAMQLLNLIHQEFNTKIDLSALFKAETVKLLSDMILRNAVQLQSEETSIIGSDLDTDSVVILKKGNTKQTLFLIHPIGGTVFCYKPLAKLLPDHITVKAIQDPGIRAANFLFNTLEELAHYYYKLIKQQQAHGPYYLAGASFGGNAAAEIARLMLADQEQVKFVGLIDSWAIYPAKVNYDFEWFAKNLSRQHLHFKNYYGNDFELPRFIIELNWQRQQLLANHVILPSALPLTLLKSAIVSPVLQSIAAKINHWDEYNTKTIQLYTIPGDHETILQQPNVSVLAKQITALLKKLF